MIGCTQTFFSLHQFQSKISWWTRDLESTASLLETLDATQKLGMAMAATATAVARRRRSALLMRATVIFMKTVLVVLCAPRTLVLCLKILQKLFTSGRRVASSPLENISTVCNCNSFYRIRLFIFNYIALNNYQCQSIF